MLSFGLCLNSSWCETRIRRVPYAPPKYLHTQVTGLNGAIRVLLTRCGGPRPMTFYLASRGQFEDVSRHVCFVIAEISPSGVKSNLPNCTTLCLSVSC